MVVTGAEEGSGLGAAILGAHALGVVDSLEAGYRLLRADAEESLVPVTEDEEKAYEHLRQTMSPLLEQYGRLAGNYAMRSSHSLAPGV